MLARCVASYKRDMRALVFLVACGGSSMSAPGWTPPVISTSQLQGEPLVIPFEDGTNGTQLVIKALGMARASGAVALSDFVLQVGECVRRVSEEETPALVDPVTFETTESDLECERGVDFAIVEDPNKEGIRDTEMREREDCKTVTHTRVVTRERVDMQHRFVPPRWDAVENWSRLPLRAGPINCDVREEKNELRLQLHRTLEVHMTPHPPQIVRPADIIAAVAKARTAADPTEYAEQALDLWKHASLESGQPPELAPAIAEAAYLSLERDVRAFLAAGVPEVHDLDWMHALDHQIELLAQRYMHIGELVLMPAAKPWLVAGAKRLATLHEHVADLFESLDRTEAARHQREAANALRASPVKR